MTHRASPHLDTAPERLWPAWLFSLVFHSLAIVILGLVIQARPRGADGPSHSSGIVLKTISVEDDGDEGDGGGNDAPTAVVEQTQLVEVLPVMPSEPVTPIATVSTPPTTPLIQTPTLTPPPNAIASSGQPSTAQFKTGDGRGRGTSGGNGHARVSVFGVQGEGSKFVYLFDRSSSMDGAPLAAAQRQLLESLGVLDTVHQFHVIFFNTRIQAFDTELGGRRIAFATDRNKQLAAKFVGGITADGGTDRLTALKSAIAFAPDVIFFLTDADDPMSPAELAAISRDNSRTKATICTIEFGRRQSPSPNNFLAELARQSGGQYGYINTATLSQ